MIRVRSSRDRGHTRLDWLDIYQPFSFGDYQDPDQAAAHSELLLFDLG